MTPPLTNATVTAVKGATAATGGRDDWDTPGTEPAGAGTPKWSGTARAYYREKIDRRGGTNGTDIITVRTLWVASTAARAMNIDTDDVITFTDPTGTIRAARAASIAISQLPAAPASVQTARIDLELN